MIAGTDKTMHEYLTNLLMDNGAAVTKQSIDELIKFIDQRDLHTIERVQLDATRTLNRLKESSGINYLRETDLKIRERINNGL